MINKLMFVTKSVVMESNIKQSVMMETQKIMMGVAANAQYSLDSLVRVDPLLKRVNVINTYPISQL